MSTHLVAGLVSTGGTNGGGTHTVRRESNWGLTSDALGTCRPCSITLTNSTVRPQYTTSGGVADGGTQAGTEVGEGTGRTSSAARQTTTGRLSIHKTRTFGRIDVGFIITIAQSALRNINFILEGAGAADTFRDILRGRTRAHDEVAACGRLNWQQITARVRARGTPLGHTIDIGVVGALSDALIA